RVFPASAAALAALASRFGRGSQALCARRSGTASQALAQDRTRKRDEEVVRKPDGYQTGENQRKISGQREAYGEPVRGDTADHTNERGKNRERRCEQAGTPKRCTVHRVPIARKPSRKRHEP